MSTAAVNVKTDLAKRKSARRKKTFMLTTMVLPGAIWLLLLRYLPMFGIILAIIYLTKNRSVTFDLTNIQKYHFWMLLLLLAASPP